MKAFEEWFSNKFRGATRFEESFYKDGWRAALEWTLKHKVTLDDLNDWIPTDDIEEELEE